MRIPLSDFNLPGDPGVPGNVVYTAIDFDINSGKEIDDRAIYTYFACGWREDDGVGVLVHGTPYGKETRYDWRVPRLISAPSDPDAGITVNRTEFHGVESMVGPFVRLVGCVQTDEKAEIKQGFLYEGHPDGSGDWYPISIPDSEQTVVKGSRNEILVCCDESLLDSVYVYSLDKHCWTELHSGYAESWEVDEIIAAGELYIIRLLHSDGKRSDVTYTAK